VGDNHLPWSQDLYPFTLERYHKVAGYLNVHPGILERFAVERVIQAAEERGIYP
jgi:hypothetical protein